MTSPTPHFSNKFGAIALLLLVALVLACKIDLGELANKGDQTPTRPETDNPDFKRPTGNKKEVTLEEPEKPGGNSREKDKGDFLPQYSDIRNQSYVEFDQKMRQQKILESITNDLNSNLSMPEDVTVTFRDCGVPNAFYNPQDKSVTMCYEFMDLFYNKYLQMGYSEEESNDLMFGATTFFFLHELGHCLIDVYDLPAVGREEDSVDQLSTYILMDKLKNGRKSALAGVLIFQALAADEQASERTFADEHSLSSQRFYNLACWMYGRDPDEFGSFKTKGVLPEARAVRCSDEYRKMSSAWQRLVDPYVKK
ncbi:MAG: DUF4344 domain-containing metallopeptidase [Pyrinomonadaceae bacterium]